jgi:hypothetical protein
MIFTDYDKDKKYRSVYKAAQKFGCEYYNSNSYGTENYHCGAGLDFVWSDGVNEFITEQNATWLLLLVESYLKKVSTITASVDMNGKIDWIENKEGLDDFLLVFLQKTSSSSAVFTIEQDTGETIKTVIRQDIPYTDIKTDTVLFYLESGVLIFPSEH